MNTPLFNLSCISPQSTNMVIKVTNIILLLLALILHSAYCIVMGLFIYSYYLFLVSFGKQNDPVYLYIYEDYKKMLFPPLAFYAVASFQQTLSSMIIIIANHFSNDGGNFNKQIWMKVILVSILCNFGFNFAIAIQSALTSTYWNYSFSIQMEAINSVNDPPLRTWLNVMIIMVRLSTVQAVLTFVLALPMIILNAIAFFGPNLNWQQRTNAQIHQIQPPRDLTLNDIKLKIQNEQK